MRSETEDVVCVGKKSLLDATPKNTNDQMSQHHLMILNGLRDARFHSCSSLSLGKFLSLCGLLKVSFALLSGECGSGEKFGFPLITS